MTRHRNPQLARSHCHEIFETCDIAVGILEIACEEPPAVCELACENDENLLPLVMQMLSGEVDILMLEGGHITLTDDTFTASVTPTEGYMSVSMHGDGGVELRSLALRDPSQAVLVIDSVVYTVDSWNLTLIGPVSGTPRSSVTTFPAGTVSFSMSVIYDGDHYRADAANVHPFMLTSTSSGDWRIDGLEVAFEDGARIWSFYNSSPLVFEP